MSTFPLKILTPEHQFFDEEVEALIIDTTDGELTILSGHAAISVPLVIGCLHIKQGGAWRQAFQAGGFMEVDERGAHVFVQACEWPENIDARRAQEAEQRALERIRQRRSMEEYQWSKTSLARAMARLRVTNTKINLD